LSGGQRTRVLLATALLGNPKLLLLDEPTVGLDPVLRQNLWQRFRALATGGTTILISSHVMDEADKCDELLFIRDGKLLIAGSRDEVLHTTKASNMEDAFLRLATEGES
jgi:ABC-2 type transport system ATP-binding protein